MSAPLRIAVPMLCALLTCCYLPSAVRRSTHIARGGWDTEKRGAWVLVTGPGATLLAAGDLLVNAFIPLNYDGYFLVDRREPEEQWFRFYTGPMLPLADVAVLCHLERATSVHSIRVLERGGALPARYEKWHFPLCIETLPGSYELEIHYFLRRTDDARDATSTRHAESTEPSRVTWRAEAGGAYALKAVMGQPAPAPGPAPRSRVSRRSSLGTARFELQEGEWAAQVERLASFDDFDEPVLEHRAAWERYERLRR